MEPLVGADEFKVIDERAFFVNIWVQFEDNLLQCIGALIGINNRFFAADQSCLRVKFYLQIVRRMVLPIFCTGHSIFTTGIFIKSRLKRAVDWQLGLGYICGKNAQKKAKKRIFNGHYHCFV
jgi:hypothetical protein